MLKKRLQLKDPTLLEATITPLVQQEKVTAFDIGYRGKIGPINLDANLYYNMYDGFINQKIVITPENNAAATPFNYLGQLEKAVGSFKKAIELDSSNTNYYSGLGDSYLNLKKYGKALKSYITATEKTEPIERPFAMIPQMYAELNLPKKALLAFYKSKESVSKESNSYINALYNIGLYEFLNKDFEKSEIAYKELIELAPNDYQSYAKLIQVYYSKKEYEKAEPLKEKLYKAYKKGELKGNLKTMFCFDQFQWKGKTILTFEKFAVKEDELYYKHIFYIPIEEGKTEFTIQTENSPISEELGTGKYAVGMDKNGTHSTFGFIKENFDRFKLKSIVVKILEEQIKAGASSRKGKN